ncbi:MAG: WD40 repeat domain-containing protein [Ferrimonas sp.]
MQYLSALKPFWLFTWLMLPWALAAQPTVMDYSSGNRWAFITDAAQPQLAVLDTFQEVIAEYRPLAVIATDIAVSDADNLLVYIGADDRRLHLWDLHNDSQWSVMLDFQPRSIKFHRLGQLLAVAGDQQVVLIEPRSQKIVHTIADLMRPLSLNFSADGYQLLISSQRTGQTHAWRLHDAQLTTWQLGHGGPVSDIILSPDARLAMVSDLSHNQVHIWDMQAGQDWRWLPFSAPVQQAYVTSDSQHLLFSSQAGEIGIVHGQTGEWISRFQTDVGSNQLRTGWLERVGVVATPSALVVFKLAPEPEPSRFATAGPVHDLVVVSDSKLLFASTANSTNITVLDLRLVSSRPEISTRLTQPNRIAMGRTNAICH